MKTIRCLTLSSSAFITLALAGFLAPNTAHAQPVVTSWQVTSSTQLATVREYKGSVTYTTWPQTMQGIAAYIAGGQPVPMQSDIQQVLTNATDVYVYSNNLASHIMGPWYNNTAKTTLFGRFPTSSNMQFRFPRTPTPAVTKPATAGDVALLVNGVICFNYGDAFSHRTSTNSEAVNGDGYWNRLAYPVEGVSFDPGNAHQPDNGTYHVHLHPYALRYQLNDNVIFTAGNATTVDVYSEKTSSWQHSPILGWAYDGYPIYGPYGYTDAMDSGSAIKRMKSGFVLRNGSNGTNNLTTRNTHPQWAADLHGTAAYPTLLSAGQTGPNVGMMRPLGRYAEDYDHMADHGYVQGTDFDLDRYNGRNCVTPEFPGGTYAYFMPVTDNAGTPAFPNIIGGQYYGDKTGGRFTNLPGGPPLSQQFTAIQDVVKDGAPPELNQTVSLTKNVTNQLLGRFAVAPSSNGNVTHTSFTIKLNGTPSGLSNLKLERTTTNTYTSPVQFGSTVTPGAGVYTATFSNAGYTTSAETFYWLRGDVGSGFTGTMDAQLTSFSVTGATAASFAPNDRLSNAPFTFVENSANDNAGNLAYSDQWQPGDNGGLGLNMWATTATGIGASATTFTAISAVTAGGSALLNNGGRAWVQQCSLSGGGSITAAATRNLSVTTANGMKTQAEMQMIPGSTGGGGDMQLFATGSSPLTRVFASEGTWSFTHGPSSTIVDTGMPSNQPTRVLITTRGTLNSFDIKLTQMNGAAVYVQNGLTYNTTATGHPTSARFQVYHTASGTPPSLIYNNITVDPTGALPVQTSGFSIE